MKFSRLNTRFAGPFQEAGLLVFLLLFCVTASGVIFAEENTEPVVPVPPPAASLDEIFPDLRDRALVCTIEARVVEDGNEVAWQSVDSKVTISGRPVSLKLAGDNVVLAIQFTPYIRFQNQSSPVGYLVVQGQIWVNKSDGGMHYQGVMQTIPVSMGEKIYFFPLGPRKNRNESSIEILFEVQPYSEIAGNAPKIEE
ncbi:MAG: hypothetical protein LBK61_07685 [Spirochaetaceae bacterium]|jgi:hypothetical protein|nr:hypothetical protein [Spirochaetaceae bacterium]